MVNGPAHQYEHRQSYHNLRIVQFHPISNISKATQENVAAFHERSLEANYSVLFLDGTYLPLRRGTVSKECIHIALGITPEGQKTVLGYEIASNENNASWSTLLDKPQSQGI